MIMFAAPHPPLLVSLGVVALIAWRVYSRVRRMVGRQVFSAKRAWATVAVFPLLLVLILLGSFGRLPVLAAVGAGVGLGVALGYLGLRLTKFEQGPINLYYTPSAHLGIALSLLLIGRVGYRIANLYLSEVPTASPSALFNSPLTLAIFGILVGYYVSYAMGLLKWARQAGVTAKHAPLEQPSA